MYAWYMPIPSTGRAPLAVSAVVLLAALSGCSTIIACQEAPDTPGTTRLKCCMNHLFRIQDVCILCKIQRDSPRAEIEVGSPANLKFVTIK